MPALSASCSCVILRCSRSALILVAIRSLGAMLCLIGVQNQNLFFSKHESLVEILLPIHVRSAAYIAPHTDRGRERRGQRVNCVQKIALKNFPNRYVNFRSGLRGNVAALVTMPNSMARGLHADCCLWDTKTLADALFGSAPNTGRGRGTRRVTRSRRRYVHRKHCARVTRARSDGRPPGGSGCSRRQILTRSGHTMTTMSSICSPRCWGDMASIS
jgi:hypothetical protein